MTQQAAETVSPWSYKGFTVDQRRKRIDERRRRVLKLVHRKLTIHDIAEELDIATDSIRKDLQALTDDGLLTINEITRRTPKTRRWVPTPETIILISEMLRKTRTYYDIAKSVNIGHQTLSRWVKNSDDPMIMRALRDRAATKKNWKPARKPTPRINLYDELEEESVKLFGLSLDEKSDENVIWMRENGFTTRMRLSTERRDGRGR